MFCLSVNLQSTMKELFVVFVSRSLKWVSPSFEMMMRQTDCAKYTEGGGYSLGLGGGQYDRNVLRRQKYFSRRGGKIFLKGCRLLPPLAMGLIHEVMHVVILSSVFSLNRCFLL